MGASQGVQKELEKFAKGEEASPAAPVSDLPRTSPGEAMLFTARDFSHSDVGPLVAVQAAQEAEARAQESALAQMSPEDRAAVLAAQEH